MHSLLLFVTFICTDITEIVSSSLQQRYFENNSQHSVHSFITSLISQRFQNCSVITLEDNLYHNDGENLQYILSENLLIGNYLVKLDKIQPKNSKAFHVQSSNARKYGNQCMIAVIFINRVDTQTVGMIRDVLAPTHMPIIRKDEDHYIFVTSPTHHRKLLLMNELPHRVKFKIAVGADGSNGLVSVSTVDFFGGKGSSPRFVQLPTDRTEGSESSKGVDYFPDFLWNLNGGLLQVTIPVTKSMVEGDPFIPINNGKRGRWAYLLEKYLMIKFNFTYHMFLATDINGTVGAGGTGLQLKNGTWVGMTGDLLYGRADIGLAIANTPQRSQYIAFSDQHFDFGCLTFVTGQPVQIYSATAVLWPFRISTWLCLIGSCIIVLLFIEVVKVYLHSTNMITLSLNFASQVRLLLAPFVEQDYTSQPSSASLRCFMGFWSFFCIVVTCFYRSKLVTLLAFPIVGRLPDTFEELAFSDFQIGFMKHGDSALNTFKASSDPVYLTLVKNMEIIEGIGLECLENVISHDKYGCIAYEFDVSYLKERNFTDSDSRKFVTNTRRRTYNIWLGIGTEAYSIYKSNFGKVLAYTMPFHMAPIWTKMDMYRNVRSAKLNWWKETNQRDKLPSSYSDEEEASSDELNFKHIHGVFYIFMGSVLVSVIVFVGELICIDVVGLKFKCSCILNN